MTSKPTSSAKTKKVFFNGFWGGFLENTDGVKFSVFKDLLKGIAFFDVVSSSFVEDDLVPTDRYEDADILVETFFAKTFLVGEFRPKNKISIFFSGEALWDFPKNINDYDLTIGTRPPNLSSENTHKHIECPLFILYELSTPSTFNDVSNSEFYLRREMCSILSSEKFGVANVQKRKRTQLVHALEKVGNFKIDHAGRHLNNMPEGFTVPGTYFTHEILDFQSQYKFALAFENCQQDDYITEKVINPIRAGIVPIYYGSRKISKYINPSRIVNIDIDDGKGDGENVVDDEKIKFEEIRNLIDDEGLWRQKVNTPTFATPPHIIFQNVINEGRRAFLASVVGKQHRCHQRRRTFNVEMICNPDVEKDRVERTVGKISRFFGVLPSYHVWGEEAVRNHRWYHRLDQRSSVSEMSLILNFVERFESIVSSFSSASASATHTLMFESDASPLFSFEFIDEKIKSIIRTMKENSLDFVFIGRGCLGIENIDTYSVEVSSKNYVFGCDLSKAKRYDVVDDYEAAPTTRTQQSTIVETGLSRCCEAFIVSIEGIKKFLNHFHTYEHPQRVGKIAIDWELNHLFKVCSENVKAGWHFPELFMQASPDVGNVEKARVHIHL